MVPAPVDDPGAEPACDCALAIIEGELGVVFASAERVAQACDTLQRYVTLLASAARRGAVLRLVPLAAARTHPSARRAFELLRQVALASANPWPILRGLLATSAPELVSRILDDALGLAGNGSLTVGADVIEDLAGLADSADSPLLQRDALRRIGRLLALSVTDQGEPPGEGVTAWLARGHRPPVRRLAARVLDLAGTLPLPEVAARLLGPAASALDDYLTYTRATHLDLVQVDVSAIALAESAAAAEARTGRALLRELFAQLGWGRVNLGIRVRPIAALVVGRSPVFWVTSSEAPLFEACSQVRRVSDRIVVVAHGGVLREPQTGDTPFVEGRAGAAKETSTIDRFRRYNLLHAEVLRLLMDISPLTPEKVRAMLAAMDVITADFALLFRSHAAECSSLRATYDGLKQRILETIDGVADGQPLAADATRVVQMFEDPPSLPDVRTLHGLKRYLHQRGLALGFNLLDTAHATNRSVDIAVASPDRVLRVARRIEYVDFEQDAREEKLPAIPYAVGIVVDGFARQMLAAEHQSLPAVKVFCYGNELHYYVLFRNHPVFIRIDYSPPLSGGMIDLQYYGVSKYELDSHPDLSLEAVQAFFRRLDFHVEVDTTRVHARYDKERALNLADICEKAEALFRLVPYLMDLDWTIGQLALPAGARRLVADAWADFLARWGVLPVPELLTEDRRGIVLRREPMLEAEREVRWNGEPPYADQFSGAPGIAFLSELRAQVRGRDLPDVRFPEHEDVAAQVPLEACLLGPLRAAVARGELVEGARGLERAPADLVVRASPAAFFASLLASSETDIARAVRLGHAMAALERILRFDTVGTVNGYDVQEAALALRGETLALYGLRDDAGIVGLAFFAAGGVFLKRRSTAGEPWSDNASTDIGDLAGRLRRNNFLSAWTDAPVHEPLVEAGAVRARFAARNPRARPRPLPADRVIAGLKASPGRVVGTVRFRPVGGDAARLDGEVLVTPSIGPDDNALLFRAGGVVCTGGGILSHAGLMAIQFGRPALIVEGRWVDERDGSPALCYRRTEFEPVETFVAGARVVDRRAVRVRDDRLRHGDLVELDADAGTLRVFGQQPAALALHRALQQLAAAEAALAGSAGDAALLADRGRRIRALHQLERLVTRLDSGVLAQFVVRELLGRAAGAQVAPPEAHARLLELLLANRSVASVVREHVEDLARETEVRARAAADEARRVIPRSRDASEILSLRLDAIRGHMAWRAVRRAVTTGDPDRGPRPDGRSGGLAEIESLTLDRLHALAAEWLRALGTPAVRRRDVLLRHRLRHLTRLSTVLRLPASDVARVQDACEALALDDAAALRRLEGRRVLGPADGGIELQPLAGWKAANLAEICRCGERDRVPAWFVVSDLAFHEALSLPAPQVADAAAGASPARTLRGAIDGVLATQGASDAWKAAAIRDLWERIGLPAAMADDIVAAYRGLAVSFDPPPDTAAGPGDEGRPYVAIRSSACEEDTEAAPRAGEFETFLFVRGDRSVLEHVKRAWSGLWSERAIHNRRVLGVVPGHEGGGVLVQRISWSRVSGVLQTVNVADRRRGEMVINVGLGMGEGIVSGAVGADHIIVSKEGVPGAAALAFRYMTNDKRQRVVFDGRTGRGTVRADTLSHQRLRPALEYVELRELVDAAARLETIYGHPLDLEFGFEGPRLRILQVRPTPGALVAWRDTGERCPLMERATTGVGE